MTNQETTSSFFDGDVFQQPERFVEPLPLEHATQGDASRSRGQRGGDWEFSRIPKRALLAAAAVVSLNLFSLSSALVSASALEVERLECSQADAGTAPPRLTREQARGARLMRAAFARVEETEEDRKGGLPDYDL